MYITNVWIFWSSFRFTFGSWKTADLKIIYKKSFTFHKVYAFEYHLDIFQLDFVVWRVYAMEYPLDMVQLDFVVCRVCGNEIPFDML